VAPVDLRTVLLEFGPTFRVQSCRSRSRHADREQRSRRKNLAHLVRNGLGRERLLHEGHASRSTPVRTTSSFARHVEHSRLRMRVADLFGHHAAREARHHDVRDQEVDRRAI